MSNEMIVFGSDLKFNMDFNELSGMVDKLGNKSMELKIEEKQTASNILLEWEENILKKLDKHLKKMNFVKQWEKDYKNILIIGRYNKPFCTRCPSLDHDEVVISKEMVMDISKQTNTLKITELIFKEIEEFEDIVKVKTNIEEDYNDEDYSRTTALMFVLEKTKLELKLAKLEKSIFSNIKKWKMSISKIKIFQDFMLKANKFRNDFDKFVELCKSKGRLARLNINIDDQDFRKNIRDIMDLSFEDLVN